MAQEPPASVTFKRAMLEVVEGYLQANITPQEINSGYCADFAAAIWEQFPEVKIFSNADFGELYSHTFIFYQGRYYDAEAMDGVRDWQQLSFFQRRRECAS